MIRFENSFTVRRTPSEVFAYVSDFTTLPEYDAYVKSVTKTSDGPIGLGSTWTHQRVQGRRQIEAPIRMVDFQPHQRFVMKSGSGAFDVQSTMTFEPAADGATKVTEVLEMRISGLLRLMEPLIARQVPKQGEEVHRKLREVLEART